MESGAFDDPTVQGHREIWQHMFAFADSMALKCAVELGIADIINSQGKPLTLQHIAAHLPSPSPNTDHLYRIMRFIVHEGIFRVHHDRGEAYPSSKWLLKAAELSLAPMTITQATPQYWHHGTASRSPSKKAELHLKKLMGRTYGNLLPQIPNLTVPSTVLWLVPPRSRLKL